MKKRRKYEEESNEAEAMTAELIASIESTDPEELPRYQKTHENYPELPTEHALKWEHFDMLLKEDPETIGNIRKTITSMERAIKKCQELLEKQEPTTIRYYRGLHNTLAEASNKTEDTLMELRMSLPLPAHLDKPDQEEIFTPSDRSPKLLYCSPETVLVWMPRLVKHSRNSNSRIFTELMHLLSSSNLPAIHELHCDFFHVYAQDQSLLGVLDVDNYPYKPVIDILARAFRTNDAAFNFSYGMYNMLSARLRPGCYLHVTKRAQKVRFLLDFEAFAEQLSNVKT